MIKFLLATALLVGSVCGGEETLTPVPEKTGTTAFVQQCCQPDVYRATLATRMRWARQDRMARHAASRVEVAPVAVSPIVQQVVTPIVVRPVAVQQVAVQPVVVRVRPAYVPITLMPVQTVVPCCP